MDPLHKLYISLLPRPPIKLADFIDDLIVWGSWQPFCVRKYSVQVAKCTVYVEGLEWGFFVWYSGFAWQNLLLDRIWHSAVKPSKMLGQTLFFKPMLDFQTRFSLRRKGVVCYRNDANFPWDWELMGSSVQEILSRPMTQLTRKLLIFPDQSNQWMQLIWPACCICLFATLCPKSTWSNNTWQGASWAKEANLHTRRGAIIILHCALPNVTLLQVMRMVRYLCSSVSHP